MNNNSKQLVLDGIKGVKFSHLCKLLGISDEVQAHFSLVHRKRAMKAARDQDAVTVCHVLGLTLDNGKEFMDLKAALEPFMLDAHTAVPTAD